MSNLTGQQFGNYRLTRHLGTGGFGEVYLGTHVHLQREAAIKLLLKLDEPEIELFRTEAQIISRLVHPHIITLFDYDVADGRPFIVMLYAEHGSLRSRYPHGTRVLPDEVTKFITQAAEGLQFAHDQRVVHRDVKPGNMLLGPGEQLQLSDFGLAVMWSNTRPISDQNVMGTRGYMAPEQFLGKAQPASDQYALAITAYQWLTGTLPMAHATMGLGLMQVAHPETPIPTVRSVVPSLSPRIDDVLQRALANSWQTRFPSVSEFARELRHAISDHGSAVRMPIPSEHILPQAPFPIDPHSRSTQLWDSTPAQHATPAAGMAAYNSASAHAQNSAPVPAIPAYEYAPPPPPVYTPPGYYLPHITPSPPGARVMKKMRPLVLPISRSYDDERKVWLWFGIYLAVLFVLGLPLSVAFSILGTASNAPVWSIAIFFLYGSLLIPLTTTLAAALFGKWRGALFPPTILVLWCVQIGILFILHPATTAYQASNNQASTSSGSGPIWEAILAIACAFCLPSISAFLIGWIYQRRRFASFGVSFLNHLAGLALILIPLVILLGVVASTSNSDPATNLAANLLVGCIFCFPVFPLAFLAAALEAMFHKIIAKKQKIQ